MKKIPSLLATLLLLGCGKTVTWQEEVQLSDGRIIVVERETVRDIGGAELAHGGSGTTPTERRIRFEFPLNTGRHVEWRSTKMSPMLIPENPLVLDIQNGLPSIMSIATNPEGCQRYIKYVYVDDRWREEPLADDFEAVPTNLYLKSGPHMPSFVDLDVKNKENRDIRYFRSLQKVGPRRIVCGD